MNSWCPGRRVGTKAEAMEGINSGRGAVYDTMELYQNPDFEERGFSNYHHSR